MRICAERMTSLSLADLSRNASAISTDSSDSSPSTPFISPRPRPLRNFSAPRSMSPHSTSPRPHPIPTYLSAELGPSTDPIKRIHDPRSRSKSRGRNAMTSTDDFKFGATLGEGSYSTASPISSNCTQHSHPAPTGTKGHPCHDWAAICTQDPRKVSSCQE